MDIRGLLPNSQIPPERGSSSSEEEPITREETTERHPRQNMVKAKGRQGTIVTREMRRKNSTTTRKLNRDAVVTGRRGIDIAEVEEEEEDPQPMPTPSAPSVSSARPAAPSRAGSQDRRQRLLEFQQQRKRQKEEETLRAKPPFRVGKYPMETNKISFNFHASSTSVTSNGRTSARIAFSAARPLSSSTTAKRQTTSTARVQGNVSSHPPSTGRPTAAALGSTTSLGGARPRLNPRNISFSEVPAEAASMASEATEQSDLGQIREEDEEPASADAAGAIDSGNVQETVAVDQTSNVGSHDDAQGQDVQPALEQVAGGASGFSTPPVDPRTDILGDEAQGQDVDVVDADQSGEPASEQVTSGASGFSTPPINPRMNLLDDEIVFKTPNVAATPGSRARGRSARRRTGAGLLLDSLRSDICTERGSSSDRRRRRMGLPPAKTPAEILGIDDLVIDDSSPLANEIRNNSEPEIEAMATSSSPNDASKKLIAEFDQLVDHDEDPNEPSVQSQAGAEEIAEPPLSVEFFKELLSKATTHFEQLCNEWASRLEEPSLSEEADGQIRYVIGMAGILKGRKGKFPKFKELIGDCEFNRGEQATNLSDLQGYWDQVTIEITQIDLKFTELAVLEGNNWVNPEPEKKKPLKKAVAKPPRPPIGSKKAPQGSSRFKAFLAQKQAAAAVGREEGATSASELATSATPKNLSPRVAVEERGGEAAEFDGGFFRIKTPTKPAANTPLSAKRERTSSSVGLTPIRKPLNKRLSELILSTHKLRRRSSINEVDDFAMSQAVGSVPEPTVGSSEDRAEAMELDDVDNEERENVQPLEGRKSNDVSASELATHSNVEGCSQLMDGSTSARRTRRSLAIVDPNPQVSATVAPAISTRHGLKSTGQIILIGEDVLTEEGSSRKGQKTPKSDESIPEIRLVTPTPTRKGRKSSAQTIPMQQAEPDVAQSTSTRKSRRSSMSQMFGKFSKGNATPRSHDPSEVEENGAHEEAASSSKSRSRKSSFFSKLTKAVSTPSSNGTGSTFYAPIDYDIDPSVDEALTPRRSKRLSTLHH